MEISINLRTKAYNFYLYHFLHFALFLLQEGLNLAIYEVKMEK